MAKNSNLHDNFLVNFYLRGFNSVLIGLYFMTAAYVFKGMLEGFTTDGHFMLFMSAQWIEILGFGILFLLVLFSSLALFFSSRRNSRQFHYKLWNGTTKGYVWRYLVGLIVSFSMLYWITNKGYTNYIAPAFFFLYGLLLFVLKKKERNYIYKLVALTVVLAILCFVFPTYWYWSGVILGVSHIVYGISVRN